MSSQVLISFLLLLLSVVYYYFQPKKINRFYGYRSRKSMKNLVNWQYSNRLAAIVLFRISLFNVLFFLVLSVVYPDLNKNHFGIFLIIQFVAMFFYIEKKTAENEKKQL